MVKASAWITGTKPWGVQSQEADGEEKRVHKAMNSLTEITEQERRKLEQGVEDLKSHEVMENWWAGRQAAQVQLARGTRITEEERQKWHNPEQRLVGYIDSLKSEGKMDLEQ